MPEESPKIDTNALEVEKKAPPKKAASEKKDKQAQKPAGYKFNTFSGVFVPSVLAIFGAVLYLIMPKVLGGIGLLKMLLIIFIAHSVSVATAFSLSAIATNIKVKGGGLYYLISRSLGSEFGGGLGIQLFLAETVSVSFYSIAFMKGIVLVLSTLNVHIAPMTELWIALISCLIFSILVFMGADFVIKLQYIILGVIVLSIASIFLGPITVANAAQVAENVGSLGFWVAFAMFFPAVIGIDTGIGMSGDLKDPKKSLVTGTFSAIIITMLVYIALVVKLYVTASPADLVGRAFIISEVALAPVFVIFGLLLATSSSALSCLMAAPRTLRAMVEDNIFPQKMKFLARNMGESPDPRVALIVSFVIAEAVIVLGQHYGGLDFVAMIVTMFFLNVYGWINGAAFFERISRNPSYRPSFSTPMVISMYGVLSCYLIMYLFNPWIMVISILFQATVFLILYRTKTSIKLESVWDGVLFQLLRDVMNKIEKTEKSKKNWRPTIVAFCANEVNRNIMFSLLDWIGANRGIMKFYYLITGNVEKSTRTREQVEEDMKNYIRDNTLDLFPRVIETEDIRQVTEGLLQCETIGNLPVNTALIDFDKRFNMENLIKLTAKLKKNVLILRNNAGFSDFRFVDIWYDDPANANLMVLIAYLITHSKTWLEKDATIRIFRVVSSDKEVENERNRLNKLVKDSRIDNITFQILVESRRKKIPQIIKNNSHYADLVIMGLPHKKKGVTPNVVSEIKRYTDGLTTSLVVLANDKIDFRIN